LEVVAFILIGKTHEYQFSTIWSSANSIVGGYHEKKTSLEEYFHLREENIVLAEENAKLKSQLMDIQNIEEYFVERDTQYVYSHLDWEYIPAKVIDMSIYKQHNYLTINKGARDGLEKDMGVIGANGVVGIISAVSEKYALVVPIIHTDISFSTRLLSNEQVGGTQWNGKDYKYVNLIDIGRHVSINKGDTVVTSGLTSVFPEGIVVGTIDESHIEASDDYHTATIALSTDYSTLKYVQVLINKNRKDIESIRNEMD
jgi:rod shape-determining protein MreC